MPTPPGYDYPPPSALPAGGNLYFASSAGIHDPGEVIRGGSRSDPSGAQALDAAAPDLMFGEAAGLTSQGEPIKNVANSSRGHVSEILNFHGSPAPWVLLGLLLVAGILHLSGEGKLGVRGGV
jgi:hypothetical protein